MYLGNSNRSQYNSIWGCQYKNYPWTQCNEPTKSNIMADDIRIPSNCEIIVTAEIFGPGGHGTCLLKPIREQ